MAKKFEELQTLARAIRDEVLEGANTSSRLGQMCLDLIDKIQEVEKTGGGSVGGYASLTSTDKLPKNPNAQQKTIGYIIGNEMYVYVGSGGNAVGGSYENVGPFVGPPGEDGQVPSIGSDGYWYLNGVKTNVKAQGAKGDSGVNLGQVALANELSTAPGSENTVIAQQVVSKKLLELERGKNGSSNIILDWQTDRATTRKKIPQENRKAGQKISYLDSNGEWINEQFIGNQTSDEEWGEDVNWDVSLKRSDNVTSIVQHKRDIQAEEDGIFLWYHIDINSLDKAGVVQVTTAKYTVVKILGKDSAELFNKEYLDGNPHRINIHIRNYPDITALSIRTASENDAEVDFTIPVDREKSIEPILRDITDSVSYIQDINTSYIHKKDIQPEKKGSWLWYYIDNIFNRGIITIRSQEWTQLVLYGKDGAQLYLKEYYNNETIKFNLIDYQEACTVAIRTYEEHDAAVDFSVPVSVLKTVGELSKLKYNLKEDKPENGYENFVVQVNYYQDYHDVKIPSADRCEGQMFYGDYGVVALPDNYNPIGKPVRLIIHCGGAGERIEEYTNPLNYHGWSYFLKKGFAVMDVNGLSPEYNNAIRKGADRMHYGNKWITQSYRKAYDYVLSKYNIAADGCFVTGISMGGLASFRIVQSNVFPVLAQFGFCPCIDIFKQNFLNPWESNVEMTALDYGFDERRGATDAQWFVRNYDKVIGYDNMLMNVIGDKSEALRFTSGEDEKRAYEKLSKYYPVPVRIIHAADDPTVESRYSQYFVDMVRRNGGDASLHLLPTGGHGAGWDGNNLVDEDGITVSLPQYECIKFFNMFIL